MHIICLHYLLICHLIYEARSFDSDFFFGLRIIKLEDVNTNTGATVKK